ncbi:MAG: cytochrome P450 family protein [Acidimicrobiales bacterium]
MTDLAAVTAQWGAHDQDDPFPVMARLREDGTVHAVTLADGHAAWLVVGYDEARTALADPRLSKDMQAALARDGGIVAEGLPGPALARHMLNVDGADHTRLRRLVSGAFSPGRVEAMQPRIAAIVGSLLDGIAAGDPDRRVDLVAAFAFPMPFTVICELLGIAGGLREAFGTELRALVDSDEHARAVSAAAAVIAMLDELVESKRRSPADDLVSALIAARDGDERLSEQELRSTIFQLVIAGHDTTTNLIGNGVVALHRHPDQLAAVLADPDRIVPAVEELMRFDPPAHHATFRYAVEDVQVGSVMIPAGSQVVVGLAAANRDPARFTVPDDLDVDRPDQRHIAFGHGIHHCLGARLARLEAHEALGSLLRRFPHMRIAVPFDELRWSHGDGVVLRGLAELPVVPGPAAVT